MKLSMVRTDPFSFLFACEFQLAIGLADPSIETNYSTAMFLHQRSRYSLTLRDNRGNEVSRTPGKGSVKNGA